MSSVSQAQPQGRPRQSQQGQQDRQSHREAA